MVFVVLGALFLMVSLGKAIDAEPWSGKWIGVVGFAAAGMSWLMGSPAMWTMGRRYGANEVSLDGSGFRLRTPAGHDLQFGFADVRRVTWSPQLRLRQCTVETDTMIFRFDVRSCPHVGRVARLIAERSGQELQIGQA